MADISSHSTGRMRRICRSMNWISLLYFSLEKCTLGKIIGKYIVLHEGDKCLMVLRPYQFYAVEKILDRVQNSNDNGYIWHTTGAGKTLTSFKAAQLVSELDDVDKVMFVVDRHDLDTQTQSEYEAFEPGAVDSTDNTDELVKRLQSNSKIIITTIQKLNAAVSKTWYSNKIETIRHSRIVMIFDECHRSHFGDSHKKIMKFFDNAQIFGFTGTPIFTENAVDGHTTKEIFGNCLHKYLIEDAIADENVLGFLVEYYHGNEVVDNDNQARMEEIAKFILNNFNKSTFDGEFDALFAVQSVSMLIRYYKIFKSLNPKIRIGAVFTYAANNSLDDEQTGMGTGQYAKEGVGEVDELQTIMDDYNNMFGTAFTTENFRAYYDDINLRMKKKKADMKPLDLCLVVGMFLTGFDSKIGFHAGVKAEVGLPQISEGVYLDMGALLTLKGAKIDGGSAASIKFNPYYLEIPVHIGYKYAVNENFAIFGNAGPYLAIGPFLAKPRQKEIFLTNMSLMITPPMYSGMMP